MIAVETIHCGCVCAIGPDSGNLYLAPGGGAMRDWDRVVALEDITKGDECEIVNGGDGYMGGVRRKREEADTPTEKMVYRPCVGGPVPYSAPNWTPVDEREPLPKMTPIKPAIQKKEPEMVEIEWKVTTGSSTVWLEGWVDGKFIGGECHTFWLSATPEKIAKVLPKLRARLLANYRSYLRTKRAEASLGGKEQIQLDD